jgi:TATA-binding protein-associated factor
LIKLTNPSQAALALEALHKQVLPFLLRRLKEDVLNDLPPKIIQDYYCELSDLQKYLYDDFGKSKASVSAADTVNTSPSEGNDSGQQHIFQSLQYLRKLCNHPALVLKSDKAAIDSAFAHISAPQASNNLNDIHHAPKLLALKSVLHPLNILIDLTTFLQTNTSRLWHRLRKQYRS